MRLRAGRTTRQYIQIKPGTYRELLYVPSSPAPITLYGLDEDAAKTRIVADLNAGTSGETYARNFGAQFKTAHPRHHRNVQFAEGQANRQHTGLDYRLDTQSRLSGEEHHFRERLESRRNGHANANRPLPPNWCRPSIKPLH